MVSKLIHASDEKKSLKHLFMLVKKDKMVQNFIHEAFFLYLDLSFHMRVIAPKTFAPSVDLLIVSITPPLFLHIIDPRN